MGVDCDVDARLGHGHDRRMGSIGGCRECFFPDRHRPGKRLIEAIIAL